MAMDMQVWRDRMLATQIAVMTRMTALRDRTKTALAKMARGEAGQTPTEYLMIVGFMAVVIVVVFLVWYWNNVKSDAQQWSKNVQNAVKGGTVKP
jgi:Flp pilus assembly pilin Flp